MPRPCVRGARGRFGGLGAVPDVVFLPFPPSRPACPALRVAGHPVRVSLTLARWFAIPRGLCVPRARSGCPSGSPHVPFACVCARAPAASAPPPPWVVWRARLARSRHWAPVGPFRVVCAPPRVLPRSLAPSGVLGGGRSAPGSPLPGLGLCAPCGADPWRSCARGAGLGRGGAARAPCPPFVRLGGPVGRWVALPCSVPLPSLGRQQSGCHWCRSGHGGSGPHTAPVCACPPSLGAICAASWRVGAGSLVPRGSCGSQRLGRGGGPCSGSFLGRGEGGPSPLPRLGWGLAPPRLGGRGGGGGGGGLHRGPPAPAPAPALPLGGGPGFPSLAPLLSSAHSPPACAFGRGPGAAPGGGGMRGGPWTAPPGAPSDLNPPSALTEGAMVMGGVMGGAAPILLWCAAVARPQAWSARRSGALVWARPSAATPAGAGGWGHWGARCAGPAASPPLAWQSLLGEGGHPLASGGAEGRSCGPQAGGGSGGGGVGGAAPPPPAPPPRRASACHPLSLARPPGVYSCRGGRRAAMGVGRGPVGRQWVSAAGGGSEGGGTRSPWFAPPPSPGRPLKGPFRLRRPGRRRCGVGRQRAGRECAGGSPGVLAAAAVPPHPGCSGLFGGGAGPPSLRSASVPSWA